jgi:hypothetical protein
VDQAAVSALIAAVVGAVSAVAAALLTIRGAHRTELARLRTELQTEFMAEEAIRQLLMHRDWKRRSFGVIKNRLRGFQDDELRRLLVRSGAVCFSGQGDNEFWGLRSRNEESLES